jgi:hypothetical protein
MAALMSGQPFRRRNEPRARPPPRPVSLILRLLDLGAFEKQVPHGLSDFLQNGKRLTSAIAVA